MHSYQEQAFIQESFFPVVFSFWSVIFLQGVFLRVQQSLLLLGGLAVLGLPHDRDVTEKIKENLIDVKFDVGIFDSTLAQY